MKLKPAQLVGLPFAIAAFVGFYWAYTQSSDYALYAAIPLILLSVTFVMSPQINWWWYKRNPPDTSAGITRFLENVPYYRLLSPHLKPHFRKRVALYMEGNQFMRPAPPQEDNRTRSDVPEDLKAAAAASAVQLTFGLKDFMLDKLKTLLFIHKRFHRRSIQIDCICQKFMKKMELLFFQQMLWFKDLQIKIFLMLVCTSMQKRIKSNI
jgi:hypothetical protein